MLRDRHTRPPAPPCLDRQDHRRAARALRSRRPFRRRPRALGHAHAVSCLAYADAPAAIAGLVRVLGAAARHVYPGPNDTVVHAELRFGARRVRMGSPKDALHARAAGAGARVAVALRDTDYGSRDFGCLDPEGNLWAFGTYAPAG